MTMISETHLEPEVSIFEAYIGMGYILIKPKAATEENDTENADEQDQSATCHLENWNGCIEEADIHQLDKIKLDWWEEQSEFGRLTVVPVRSQAAGIHKRSIFQPCRGCRESDLLWRSGPESVWLWTGCRRDFNHVYMTGRKPGRDA